MDVMKMECKTETVIRQEPLKAEDFPIAPECKEIIKIKDARTEPVSKRL